MRRMADEQGAQESSSQLQAVVEGHKASETRLLQELDRLRHEAARAACREAEVKRLAEEVAQKNAQLLGLQDALQANQR
jgi:hypothetical protein